MFIEKHLGLDFVRLATQGLDVRWPVEASYVCAEVCTRKYLRIQYCVNDISSPRDIIKTCYVERSSRLEPHNRLLKVMVYSRS
jgi:hypothetical protein